MYVQVHDNHVHPTVSHQGSAWMTPMDSVDQWMNHRKVLPCNGSQSPGAALLPPVHLQLDFPVR